MTDRSAAPLASGGLDGWKRVASRCRKRIQRKRYVSCRLEPLVRILLQTSPHDAIEARRQFGVRVRQLRGSSFRIAFIVSTADSPVNARRPLNIS